MSKNNPTKPNHIEQADWDCLTRLQQWELDELEYEKNRKLYIHDSSKPPSMPEKIWEKITEEERDVIRDLYEDNPEAVEILINTFV